MAEHSDSTAAGNSRREERVRAHQTRKDERRLAAQTRRDESRSRIMSKRQALLDKLAALGKLRDSARHGAQRQPSPDVDSAG